MQIRNCDQYCVVENKDCIEAQIYGQAQKNTVCPFFNEVVGDIPQELKNGSIFHPQTERESQGLQQPKRCNFTVNYWEDTVKRLTIEQTGLL